MTRLLIRPAESDQHEAPTRIGPAWGLPTGIDRCFDLPSVISHPFLYPRRLVFPSQPEKSASSSQLNTISSATTPSIHSSRGDTDVEEGHFHPDRCSGFAGTGFRHRLQHGCRPELRDAQFSDPRVSLFPEGGGGPVLEPQALRADADSRSDHAGQPRDRRWIRRRKTK